MSHGIRLAASAALLAAAAVVALGPAAAQTEGQPDRQGQGAETLDLGGVYRSQGTNPDGSSYQSLVEIKGHGGQYLVSWLSGQAANGAVRVTRVVVGVGIVNGDVLSVSYSAGRTPGIVTYKIGEKGERLVGRWAVLGDDGVYDETLTRLPANQVPQIPQLPQEPESAPSAPIRRPPPPGTFSL